MVGKAIVLVIDLVKETTELATSKQTTFNFLPSVISPNITACFLLYRMEKEPFDVLFAFVTPSTTPIKQRMLYAASKAQFLAATEELLGKPIKKKYEVESVGEIDESLTAPVEQTNSARLGFSKPARPGKK